MKIIKNVTKPQSTRGVAAPATTQPNSSAAGGKCQRNGRRPVWWETRPAGEKQLLAAIMRMLRSAKRSPLREVASAAVSWECGISCFMKVRLINRCRARQLVRETDPARRKQCLRCQPPHPACEAWAQAGQPAVTVTLPAPQGLISQGGAAA